MSSRPNLDFEFAFFQVFPRIAHSRIQAIFYSLDIRWVWRHFVSMRLRADAGRGRLADPTTVSKHGSWHLTSSVPSSKALRTTISSPCRSMIDSAYVT
jgi:hypothetical protein